MEPTFGARLRAQRERQQVALTTIAEQTKIRLSLLEELERDDVSRWPTGIFRRSYIRHYATAVGLEPDALVREFLSLYPDDLDNTPEAVTAARGLRVQPSRESPPTRLTFLLHSAMDALPALRAEPMLASSPAPETTPAAEARAAQIAAAPERPPVPEPGPLAPPISAPANPETAAAPGPVRVDLSAVARLCTKLGCALDVHDVLSLLEDAAGILDAVGVTMWIADHENWLTAVLAHGYPNGLAKLPHVPSDAHNAVAAAFRSGEICVVDGSGAATGAVAVPILTAAGCAGVFALELMHRREQHECVRAAATIIAAQLSTLIASPALVCASPSLVQAATA